MKMVHAIIQPDMLDAVRNALIEANITRITVARVAGHGQQDNVDLYRGQEVVPSLHSKMRVSIACNDEFVETAIEAILKSAKHATGRLGDGKIFVTPLDECIRIRTGERGSAAI
jgi:nitrogen regulatory protein P-II 1